MNDEIELISTTMARISLNSDRYYDSIQYLKESLHNKNNLNKNELDMLSESYKRILNSPRNALIIIDTEIFMASPEVSTAILEHRKVLIDELTLICQEVINFIDKSLLTLSNDSYSIVFFNKLKGDYYRYLAEYILPKESAEIQANRAKSSYETALVSIGDEFQMSDPLYLGLILNYSIFQYEILGIKEEAIERSDSAFNEAVRYLEDLEPNDYFEATKLLQLLRDNVNLWKEIKNE